MIQFSRITLLGLLLIPHAWGNQHFCAKVSEHKYNPERNTLTVKLDKKVYTDEGTQTDIIDVITTEQKLMVKIALTRPNTKVCFQGLSTKTPEKLNAYLSNAAQTEIKLFKHPLPEGMTLTQVNQKFTL